MLPNLVLIGFMGCGKSSVGRRLSGLTGHRFVDTDDLVVQVEGRSIAEIFAQQGAEYFRDVEQRCLEELIGVCGIILSTGGGLVMRPVNRQTLKKIGIIAWLDAHPDVLFERAMRSGRRPLLQTAAPRETFDSLLAERRPIYDASCDFRIDSTAYDHEAAAQMVIEETMRLHRRFAC